jgi:hypothetical protein
MLALKLVMLQIGGLLMEAIYSLQTGEVTVTLLDTVNGLKRVDSAHAGLGASQYGHLAYDLTHCEAFELAVRQAYKPIEEALSRE